MMFRLLLLLYPRRLRERLGEEMTSTFEAHLEEARSHGSLSVLRVWLRELRAALWHGLRARWRERRPEARRPFVPSERLRSVLQDVRIALRSFARTPSFVVVVVLTLGLGIGANTAIFSVVDGVLLEPLPFTRANELYVVWSRFLPESGFDLPQFELSEPEYLDYQEQSSTMSDVAALSQSYGVTLTGAGTEPERVTAASVTANFFSVLAVVPELGRSFTTEDDLPSGPDVALLSYDLWQRRHGGDPEIIGRVIEANARSQQIVGVMPDGFAYPEGTEIWFPLQLDREKDRTFRNNHYLWAIGRVAPGVSYQEADAELATIMRRWAEDFPDAHSGHFLFLRSLTDETVGEVRPALLVLLAAVGLLLLIACANVANIVLARGESRQREIALRTALGAGRTRVLQQWLAESLLLSFAGGALGLLMARYGVGLLLAVDEDALPRRANVAMDGGALVFTIVLTIATAVVFALLPVLYAQAGDLFTRLKTSGGSAGTSRGRQRFRAGLIVAEVALCLLLMLGAGLLLKSFARLLDIDPGFHGRGTLTARVSLPSARYPEARNASQFFDMLVEQARALPGVRRASGVSMLPLLGTPPNNDFRIEGRPDPAPGEPIPSGNMVVARPGYFESLGIDVLRGRSFRETDRDGAIPVAVISRKIAEQFWPNEDPIGRRLNPLFGEEDTWLTIVGVVEDVRHRSLDVEPRPTWYFPFDQAASITPWILRSMTVVLGTDGDPMRLAGPLRQLVRELDEELVVTSVETMESVVYRSVARRRFVMTLLSAFAGAAIALAAIGIYGVLSFTVVQRNRELGIRGALGATRGQISRHVLGQAMSLTTLGLVLGTAAALATTRVLGELLFGVSPTDAPTFVGAGVAVSAVAMMAALVPARRAASVDPVIALRSE